MAIPSCFTQLHRLHSTTNQAESLLRTQRKLCGSPSPLVGRLRCSNAKVRGTGTPPGRRPSGCTSACFFLGSVRGEQCSRHQGRLAARAAYWSLNCPFRDHLFVAQLSANVLGSSSCSSDLGGDATITKSLDHKIIPQSKEQI